MSMTTVQLSQARGFLADPGTSATQQITIENANAGTFTISYDGQTTSALAFNVGGNVMQNALCALSNVGTGNVTVVQNDGVPNAIVYVVSFVNDLGGVAQSMLTVDDALLVGVGVLVTVQQNVAGGTTAFTDDELNGLYTLADNNYFLGICYGYRELMANAAKFNNYVAGQTKEDKAQIFDHLKIMADMYLDWAFAADQVQFSSLTSVPPRVTAVPVTSGVPATSLQYGGLPWGVGPWGRGRYGGRF